MRKILLTVILLALTMSIFSCSAIDRLLGKDDENKSNDDSKPSGDVRMIARITEMGDKISVDVLESEYTSGIHWVITSSGTEFYDKNGATIARSDLKVGDKVEILYSGQVMMSYPPQIVAARISVQK